MIVAHRMMLLPALSVHLAASTVASQILSDVMCYMQLHAVLYRILASIS